MNDTFTKLKSVTQQVTQKAKEEKEVINANPDSYKAFTEVYGEHSVFSFERMFH